MNRKQFILGVAAAGAVLPCLCLGKLTEGFGGGEVDAGPITDFAADGLYTKFRDRGFFVIRKGGKLIVLSSICTHRRCRLESEPDQSFSCDCHGSTFSPDGWVTHGPATRDLPVLPAHTNKMGRLIVVVP